MPTKPRTKSQPWLRQIPHNMHYPRSHYFRGLSELDVDNLKCGRITRQTMGQAMARAAFQLKNCRQDFNMLLADELNDMLDASKK